MLNYDLEDLSERLDENYQENSSDSGEYYCQIDKFSSKYIETFPQEFPNNPIPFETISNSFTFEEALKKDFHLLNIDDESAHYINQNKPSQLLFKLENPIQKNEIKDSQLHSNDNKDIAAKPNLNKKNQENQTKKEIKPLNEEQDGIKENNINTNSFNFIFDILKKINYQTERINKIKGDITEKDIKNITLFEVRNKKNKKKKNNRGGKTKKKVEENAEKNKNKQEIKENKIKCGRKKLDDKNTSQGNHKKDCPDNIIKKIKAFLFTSVIEYVEQYINSQNIKEKIKLLRLDYKYINNLKKEDNIKVLNEQLRNIVSLDTSSRYANYQDKSWNKKMIKKILAKNDEKINSLLNLSFSTWIDIFTYRQKWENNIQFYKIKNYLEKIQDENDSEYFSKFIFYLFNYQRWFLHKKGRRPKVDQKKGKK